MSTWRTRVDDGVIDDEEDDKIARRQGRRRFRGLRGATIFTLFVGGDDRRSYFSSWKSSGVGNACASVIAL